MTANWPIDIARQSGANIAHAVRRVFDWTMLPRSGSFWLELPLRGPLEELPTLHSPFGRTPAANLLAPHWNVHKNQIRALLAAELERRGTRQGSRCRSRASST